METLTAKEIISLLNLRPHPKEGGYFSEIYRSEETVAAGALPPRYKGVRAFGTAIYYLLTPDTFSMIHRLASDEIFHFYIGDTVEMLNLLPGGLGRVIELGTDLKKGQRPQVVVPRGVWQGARLKHGGSVALMGTTVAPGFDFADYEEGGRGQLIDSYPQYRDMIISLTK